MTRPPLSLVPDHSQPPAGPVPASRVRLAPWARLQVEQAREAVMDLDGATAGADLPRAMYLLGLLAGNAQTLIDVLDAVTEVG